MTERRTDRLAAPTGEGLHDLARLAFRSFRRRMEREMVAHGVSPGQWRFLRQLWHDNGICQRQLAERLALSEATATVTLRELEKKKLIERRRNAGNRRELLVFLTPGGRALQDVLLPITRDVHILATQEMSAVEVTTLARLLHRLVANLDRL